MALGRDATVSQRPGENLPPRRQVRLLRVKTPTGQGARTNREMDGEDAVVVAAPPSGLQTGPMKAAGILRSGVWIEPLKDPSKASVKEPMVVMVCLLI